MLRTCSSVTALAAAVVVSGAFATDGVAADYLPPSQAPVKPGNYRSKEGGHFVLSAQRKAALKLQGRIFHVQDFLFLTWKNPDGYFCGMDAFSVNVVSPPHLPDGVAAGLLDGISGPPGGQPDFHYHGRFIYRGKAKSKAKRRPNSINMIGTCNGVTDTRLYTWAGP